MSPKTIKPAKVELVLIIFTDIIWFVIIAVCCKIATVFLSELPITFSAILISLIIIFTFLIVYDYFSFFNLSYSFSGTEIISRSGIFWKDVVTIPYHKITNLDTTQGPLQRIYRIGNLKIQTAGSGSSTGETTLMGLDDFIKIKNDTMKAIENTRSGLSVKMNTEESVLLQILAELKKLNSNYSQK